MENSNIKQKYFLFASAAMILPPAFLFYILSNTPHIFIVTLIIYSIALIRNKPIHYSDRSIIYSTLSTLILAVLLNMFFPMHQERFISIGKAFTPQITIPFALFLAATSTFFKGNSYIIGINAALAMFVLLMAGDFQGLTSYNENYSSFSYLVEVQLYSKTFMSIAIFELLAMIYAFSLSEESNIHHSNKIIKKYKYIVIPISLALTVLISFIVFYTYSYFKQDLRNIESYIMQFRPVHNLNSSRVIFGKEADLNQTINENMRKNKRAIMIRVKSERPPGYLRGRSYDYYNMGKWSKFNNKKHRLKENASIDQLAISAFYVYNTLINKKGAREFNIYLTNNCISNYIFYPPESKRIEMVAEHLNYTTNGDLIPYTWNKTGGYIAYTYENSQLPAYQTPKNPLLKNYLYIPQKIKNDLLEIIADIPELHKSQTEKEIVKIIINYLNENYSYSLNHLPPPDNIDPTLFFLQKTNKGHCELFATSAALLLRMMGIPTRYVTGFICDEQHPSGKYFIARMANAHAWTEAYMKNEKKWILVEATPPGGINPYEEKWGYFEEWLDRIKYNLSKGLADLQRGYFTKAVVNFITDIFFIALNFIYNPIRAIFILIFFAIIILLWTKYKKRKRLFIKLPNEIIHLRKELISLIKNLKVASYTDNITLTEWLNKIKNEQTIKKSTIQDLEKIIKNYRIIRFSKTKIDENKLDELKKSIKKFKKNKFN